MATTIITKNGSGAPAAGDLVQGELAVDLTNQTLYSKDSSGNVFKVGDTGGGSPGTFTDLVATDSFTSPGIDDNANATAITIDANENVGIGTGIPQQILELASTTDPTLRISNTETALSYNDPIGGLEFYTNDASGGGTGVGSSIRAYSDANFGSNQQGLSLRFSTRPSGSGAVDTERMRIDSTGKVGIGNTNPTRDLDVGDGTSSANVGIRASSSPNILFTSSGANVGYIGTTLWNTGAGSDTELSVRSENDLTFTTGSSERMRIDDSGRVGIGNSSPSSYTGAGAPSLVIGDHTGFEGVTLASSTSGTGNIAFADSASGSEQYRGLMRYDHSEDSMQLWTNSVRRMTIDTSGKVGIGVTNPQQALHVAGGGLQIEGNISAPAAGTECALIDYFNNNMRLWSRGTATTRGTFEFIQVENDGQNQQSSMVIDTTGNVGIGTPAPEFALDVGLGTSPRGRFSNGSQSLIIGTWASQPRIETAGGQISFGTGDVNPIVFKINSSEAARIDTSGNLLVGTTAPIGAGASGVTVADISSAIGQVSIGKTYSGTTGAMKFYYGSTEVGRIDYSDTTTTYITSSDERLKENVVDAPAGNIDALQVRSFDWKIDGEHQEYGFIAQELETVAPYAVSKGETDEDMWGVDYSKLVPMLVKEIQDLKAEVAALKGA